MAYPYVPPVPPRLRKHKLRIRDQARLTINERFGGSTTNSPEGGYPTSVSVGDTPIDGVFWQVYVRDRHRPMWLKKCHVH